MNPDLDPFATVKSASRTPVTSSENVAVTVKAPFVGSGAPVVRATVGASVSTACTD